MPTKEQQERMEEEWNNLSDKEQQKRLRYWNDIQIIEEVTS